MSTGLDRLVLWDVVQEHLEEAGFLWMLWERSLDAPDFTLPEVIIGDEKRLLAHLDGLVVGGSVVARRLLLPAVTNEVEDAELTLAAALALLLGEGSQQHVGAVVEALAGASGDRRHALRRALELAPLKEPAATMAPLLVHPDSGSRSAALDVLAFHKVDMGEALASHMEDTDPLARAAALGVARAHSGQMCRPYLERALGDSCAEIRDAALDAGLVHGLRAAWHRCRELARDEGGHALLLVGLLGGPQDFEVLAAALHREADREAAILALGYSGWPESVELCLDQLEGPPQMARLAGEAVCAICGLDVRAEGMVVAGTEPDEHDDMDADDLDADLVVGPEASLPLLEAGAVRDWWERHRCRFPSGTRYMGGLPRGGATIRAALETGPVRRRHVMALELALRTGGTFRLETRTWGRSQLQVLQRSAWPETRLFTAQVEEILQW